MTLAEHWEECLFVLVVGVMALDMQGRAGPHDAGAVLRPPELTGRPGEPEGGTLRFTENHQQSLEGTQWKTNSRQRT